MIIKKLAGVLILVLFAFSICAQKPLTTYSVNGKFYAYWGWNSSSYSKSNIHFKGNNYDFTLLDIKAKDRQSVFSVSGDGVCP